MTRKPKPKPRPSDKTTLSEFAVSDEAAAYIADALMELALQFESLHFAQILRHYQSIKPPDVGPCQHDPFGEQHGRNRRKRKTADF
jgi:hypothetical protein